MRFLGGLLKTMAIVILIAATVICTAIAVMAEVTEAYWIMALCWVCAVFVGINILATGIALTQVCELKKRVLQLEQRNANSPTYTFAPSKPMREEAEPAPVPAPAAEKSMPFSSAESEQSVSLFTPQAVDSSFNAPLPPQQSKGTKAWIPAMVAACIAVATIIAVVLIVGNGMGPVQGPDEKDPNANAKETTAPKKDTYYSDAIELKLGDSIESDHFRMTFESVELLDEYTHEISDNHNYSPFVEDGYKLLMLRGHFENLSTSAIQSSSLKLIATVNGNYVVEDYGLNLSFMRNNTYVSDPYTEMEYLLCLNIPEKLAGMFETVTFTIGFNDDMSYPSISWNSDGTTTYDVDNWYAITSGLTGEDFHISGSSGDKKAESIAIGDTVITEDYEFTLKDVELTYEVLPPHTGSVYSSYVAPSGKVYIHVAADVKNTMQRDIRIEELFEASALYDGKYPYSGFIAVDDDNRFDWVGSYVAATPLETCGTHAIIECPVEVDTSGKSIVVTMIIGDTTYEYILR